jgi:tRNA pseudouridine38-40 synthase
VKRIGLILEYDGTDYVGWQRQPNGLSVQQVVEEALAGVLGQPVRLLSSGRTDAGVHARGLVVQFETDRDLPLTAYREGVNRHLPASIAVREAWLPPPGFHARFDAAGKWYRYSIYRNPVRSPLCQRTAWHLRGVLDLETMAGAARDFVGRHDFAAFRSSGCDAVTTEREIFSVEWAVQGELLHFDVRGGGFLRNMVRVMVGTLVEIGLGRRPQVDISRLLAGGRRVQAGRTAPPQGLCLMAVWYPDRETRPAGNGDFREKTS